MLSVAPKEGPDGQLQLHATTVVIKGRAVVLAGPSGVGKSGLALTLMAYGADLLADDVTWIDLQNDRLTASCPPMLAGRIEARGLGILAAPSAPASPLVAIVDLGTPEDDRLPPRRTITLLGKQVALLHTPVSPYFAPMIMRYMLGERIE